MQKVYLGSDHGGFELKEKVKQLLEKKGIPFEDLGCHSTESCDYPEFGRAVGKKVVANPGTKGIVMCGSGVGISIAVNRVKGARAVLANSLELVTLGRQHNDANVLAMGGRTKFFDPWEKIVETFLDTKSEDSERHVRRRAQLDQE